MQDLIALISSQTLGDGSWSLSGLFPALQLPLAVSEDAGWIAAGLAGMALLGVVAWEASRYRVRQKQELIRMRETAAVRAADAKRLEESERTHRLLYNSMGELMALHELVRDASGKPVDYRLLECNAAFTAATGISREQAVGGLASQIFGTGTPPYLAVYARVVDTGEPAQFETYFEPLNKHFRVSVFSPGLGRDQFATLTWDITDRKHDEERIEHAKDLAESANRAKDRFLATLSHELRTPLTPVLAILSSLSDDPTLREDLARDVAIMRRNIELEARLIDDLLDLTRITRGKLRLQLSSTDVHECLRNAIDITHGGMDAKQLRLDVHLDARKTHIDADFARIHQVFWNILRNAVQYTPSGGRITVRTRNDDGVVTTEITDSGEGIDPEFLPHVFDTFAQSPRHAMRAAGGVGLGMAIARSVVDLHGGTIEAESQGIGRGSVFRVRLPLMNAAAVGRPIASHDGPCCEISMAPLRLLLVEDHASTLAVMTRLLGRMGHHITTADSFHAGLDKLLTDQFDVLLSDIGLPDGSGLELLEQAGERRPPHAIAISGFGMESDISASRNAGFDVHLVKPVSLQALTAALRSVSTPRSPSVS